MAAKWFRRAIWLVVGLAAAAAAFLLYARTSLPRLDGVVALSGPEQEIEIRRDEHGIPLIAAQSEADAAFALGFVHAQDRLWQMEFQRVTAAGRLSELFGARLLEADKALRAIDLKGHAEAAFPLLSPETRRNLERYADGVNAAVKSHRGALPIEFLLLAHSFEPWRPQDSVLILKFMAVGLCGNGFTELARARALAIMSPREVEDLFPPNPGETPPPLPDFKSLYADLDGLTRALASLPHSETTTASNNWVLSGARTDTGKPYLANDPHLGLTIPGIFYLAAVRTPEGSLVGATFAGTPAFILGHNDHVAWGFTNAGADVQDLYLEKPDAVIASREETIHIRFAEPQTVKFSSTRHGPLLPGSLTRGVGRGLALAWTALDEDDGTMDAANGLRPIASVEAAIEHFRGYVAPMQAMVFADDQGNIGLLAPGRVPVRKAENLAMGRLPVPGEDPEYDWIGTIPFEQLPHVVNPARGWIATANARFVGPDYKPFLTFDWDAPNRADRIQKLIEERAVHDMDSMKAMQRDLTSPSAEKLLDVMLAAAPEDAIALKLKSWDRRMTRNSPAPLMFAAWSRALTRRILTGKFGARGDSFVQYHPLWFEHVLTDSETAKRWCKSEGCRLEIADAFREAKAELAKTQGDDFDQWRWGGPHRALLEHQPFGYVPVLRDIFSREVASDGGADTLFRGMYSISAPRPYANNHAAVYRAIYDLADLDRSQFMISTGESGNVFSPHYDDLIGPWEKGEYFKIPQGARHRLLLVPGSPP